MPVDRFRRLKEQAAREGRSMPDLANDLLRDGLARLEDPTPYQLRIEGWEAQTQPGVDLLDRDKLLDAMDER